MPKKITNDKARFQSINDAAKIIGLSTYALRKGVKNGTVPHIKVGHEYRIDMVKLNRYLDEGGYISTDVNENEVST